MIIRYQGHAFFTLTLENGTVIAMDPYDTFYQYPCRRIAADIVTMSHAHHDHSGTDSIINSYQAILDTGIERLPQCTITGIETCHDHHNGAHRGKNTFYIVEAEGLRIGHAGDLGHLLSVEQIAAIGKLDVLLLPVGGYYTIDAAEAVSVWKQLAPKVCIPMHYRTQYNPDMPITAVDDFLKAANAETMTMPMMRLAAGDMSQRPPVVVLEMAQA